MVLRIARFPPVDPATLCQSSPCAVPLFLQPSDWIIRTSSTLANSGEMQIELIQQEGDTPSIYTEFLRANGPGYHQLAYWTDDFDATMASVRDAGWPVVWLGDEDVGTRFAYLEPPNSPAHISPVIEIMELNDLMTGMATFVRDAARTWDGSDPIRVLGA